MKTKKSNLFKILCGVLSLSMMTLCAVLFIGCNDNTDKPEPDPEPPVVTVTLDQKTLTLTEWQSATLVATKTGTEEAVVWTSSETSVATVDNGKVTAILAGTTTITASVGEVSDTCTVTVEATDVEPVVGIAEIGEDKKLVVKDVGSFDLHASVLWDGEELGDATIEWISENEEIATVTGDGYTASLSGLKEGETVIKVVAKVRRKTAVYEFTVKVNPESALLKTDGEAFVPGDGGYKVTLNAVEEIAGDNTNAVALDFYATYKGNKIDKPNIVWTTENNEVIAIESGKVTAKKAGSALISGVWHYDVTDKDYSVKVTVEVVRVNVTDESVKDVVVNRENAFAFDISDENIESYVVDGKTYTDGFTVEENTATFDGANFDLNDQTKTAKITITTDKRVYTFVINSYYAIANVNEWKGVWNKDASATIFSKASVVKIENDIDVSSYSHNGNINYAVMTSFSGVFDGQGHTIVGATAGWAGLFNSLAEDGVVKNVAFIGVKFLQEATVFYNKVDGRVENCYFEGYSSRTAMNATPAFCITLGRKAVVRNVVMNIRGRDINAGNEEQNAIFRLLGAGEGQPVVSGVYAYVDVSNGKACDDETINGMINLYSSANAMNIAVTALPDGFSADMWQIYDGILSFKTSQSAIASYIEANALTVTPIESVNKEVPVTLTSNIACTWGVEGLEDSEYTLEEGVLTLLSTATAGNTFTIVGTYTESRFGYVYTQRVENVEIKKKPAEVKALDDKPTVGLNRTTETYSFTLDEEAEVLSVTVNGTATEEYTVSGNVVTLKAGAFGTVGEVEIVIETDAVLYKASAEVFDYAIGTLAEFKTFWNKDNLTGTVTSTVVITADIDATGYENGGNIPAFDFAGVLDGRGHTLNNVRAGWSGLFYNLTSTGVVKNVAFTGIKLLKSSMIFGYNLNGTVENCYFEGATVRNDSNATPAFCSTLGRTAVVRNVVVNVHDSLANQNGQKAVFNYYGSGGTGLPTIEGLYAVVDYSNGTASNEATANEKINLYATATELRNAVKELPEGFSSDIWQIYDGVLSFKTSQSVIESYISATGFTVTPVTSVMKETETKLNADKTCVWSVEGLDESTYTIDGDLLTLSSGATAGNTFTIVATYVEPVYGHVYTERIENVEIKKKPAEVKTLDEVVIAKNKPADLVITVTDGETFDTLYIDENVSESSVTVSGTTATLSYDVVSALASGEHVIKIETSGSMYVIPVVVADFAIDTADEFTDWYKNKYETNLSATIVLTSDIVLDSSTAYANGKRKNFAGVFDGMGHTIANFTANAGFIDIMSGTMKDVAFVNVKQTGNEGFIGHQLLNGAKLINVYYQGVNVQTTADSSVTRSAFYPYIGANANLTIENVVIILERNVGSTSDSFSSNQFDKFLNNVYVVNTCSKGSTASAKANVFASIADFTSAVTTLPDGFDSNLWTTNPTVGLTFKSATPYYSEVPPFADANIRKSNGVSTMSKISGMTVSTDKTGGLTVYEKILSGASTSKESLGSSDEVKDYSSYAFAMKVNKAKKLLDGVFSLPENQWLYFWAKKDSDEKIHMYYSYSKNVGYTELVLASAYEGYRTWFNNLALFLRFSGGTANEEYVVSITDLYVVS